MSVAEDDGLRLRFDERLRLIEQLWDRLVDERGDSLPLSPAVRAELDRRLQAHRASPGETLSWSELERRVHEAWPCLGR